MAKKSEAQKKFDKEVKVAKKHGVNIIGTHKSHCYQGEYRNSCKYGEESICPAKPLEIGTLGSVEVVEIKNKKIVGSCNYCTRPASMSIKGHQMIMHCCDVCAGKIYNGISRIFDV